MKKYSTYAYTGAARINSAPLRSLRFYERNPFMIENRCCSTGVSRSFIYISFALILLVLSIVFLNSCDKNDVTTEPPVSSEKPVETSYVIPEFSIDPEKADKDADITVSTSDDKRTITIKVPSGTETIDIGKLAVTEHQWTITDSDGVLCENGIISISPNAGADNSFTVYCGIEKVIYRILVRYYDFYTVTFETLESDPVTVREGSTITAPDVTPVKEGYTFSRWDFDFTKPITSDTTVSCVWTPKKYKITFDADGGSVTPATLEVVFGEAFTLPVPVKQGFGFGGWFNGTTQVTDGVWSTAADVTLKASWKENIYTITYDPAGGTVPILKQGVSYGQVYTPQVPTRIGYNFKGWYVNGELVTGNVYNFSSDTTYVAQWSEMVYKVNYVTNGGSPMESELKLFSEMTDAVPVRAGYTFGGWYFNTDLNSTDPVIGDGGSVTLYAYWTNERKAADFSYEFTDDGVIITDFKVNTNVCVIPVYIGGKKIISISDHAFENSTALVEVVIPEYVTSIGECAFEGCSLLSRINLDGISSLGPGAFSGCGFSSFTVPASVTHVPDRLLSGCKKLTDIDFSGAVSFGDGIFSGCTSLAKIVLPQTMTDVGKEMFSGCTSLKDVTFGSEVKSVGEAAFSGCTSLVSITWPSGVTEIEDSTFDGCTLLSSIIGLTSESYVVSIGERAFADCSELSLIIIPSAVSSVGKEAFSGCSSVESIALPAGIKEIPDGLFDGCTSLKSVTLLGNVVTIGKEAFRDCTQISSVLLGNALVSIGGAAFENCVRLSTVSLPASLAYIGENAFSGCTKLDKIVIPSKITTLPAGVFDGCTSMESVSLRDGILHIGDRAFSGCTSLSLSSMPDMLISIGNEAFSGCTSLLSLEFQNTLARMGNRAFAGCSALTGVRFYGSQEQWNGLCADDSFEGCISLGTVSVLTNIVDDLVPYIKPNTLTSELWTIDSSLDFNGRTPAVVLGFVEYNPFWRNFVVVDDENPDIASCAQINDKYIWVLDISGQILNVTEFSIIDSGGETYIILDVAGAGFIPLAGKNRYTATLRITDMSGKVLYTAELGETVFNNVVQSLTEDPSRTETERYEDIHIMSPGSSESANSVSNLFDADIFTKFSAQCGTEIVISTSEPLRLASYSLTTALFSQCYPDAVPAGWTLYGGDVDDDGQTVWTEISVVEASGISADGCREYNYKVDAGEEYSLYKLVFSGSGIYMLSGFDLYVG